MDGFRRIDESEFQQPILLFAFATWFLLLDPTNSGLSSYSRFSILSDAHWASLFAAAGITKAAAIITGNFKLNLAAIVFVIILWSVVLYLFAASNYHSHAVPIMIFFIYINVLRFKVIIEGGKAQFNNGL